jgi:hypothetical protein
MTDRAHRSFDWRLATYAGNRRRQHQEFKLLPFREKLALIEELGRIAELFASRRTARRRRSGPHSDARDTDHG